MKKQKVEVDKLLLIKASIFLVLILITAFFVGMVLGRHGAPVSEILPENEIREKLDTCKYQVQEVLRKYNLKTVALARCIDNSDGRGADLSRPVKIEPVVKVKPVVQVEFVEKVEPVVLRQAQEPKKVKQVEPVEKPKPKKCLYAIQLFSDTNKSNARKALSQMTNIKARLETATVRNSVWYRIRYGCYVHKKEARDALTTIKEKYGKAIIVAH